MITANAIVCAEKPLALEVDAGIHWWCSCGRSVHQPFCDGSHKGTGRQPVKVVLTEKTTVHWCQCEPLCDSSHLEPPQL
jgi:CDGSH iron-sulfur domain-containing protein 3